MGNQKVKWTSEEEEALKAGIAKHGTGRWKNIIKDPEFAHLLINRSNIDLKDKWRNMSFAVAAEGSNKPRFARGRQVTMGALVPSIAPSPLAVASASENEDIDDSPRSPQEGKSAPTYDDMIFEALKSMKGTNGSDLGAIVGFIEQRFEVPSNFKRLLSTKLRRLVLQGKLERVQNCYKIKGETLETKISGPKQRNVQPQQATNSDVKFSSQTLEQAARIAAHKIAEAENKSCLAAEAVKDAETMSKMAEDAESILHLIKGFYDQCSQGQIVLLA